MLRHLSFERSKSETTTRTPASARLHAMWEPMNPAPPVTTTKSALDTFAIIELILNKTCCCSPDRSLQSLVVDGALYHNTRDYGAGDGVQKGEELLELVEPCVGDIDDVLVLDREALRQEIGIGIAHIEA